MWAMTAFEFDLVAGMGLPEAFIRTCVGRRASITGQPWLS